MQFDCPSFSSSLSKFQHLDGLAGNKFNDLPHGDVFLSPKRSRSPSSILKSPTRGNWSIRKNSDEPGKCVYSPKKLSPKLDSPKTPNNDVNKKCDSSPIKKTVSFSILLPEPPKVHTTETPRKRWEFGRRKSFTPPPQTPRTNAAAINIQRMVRGWWQRLTYRIALLEYKLENKDAITRSAVQKVYDDLEKRKAMCKKRMAKKAQKELNKVTKEEETAMEAQKVIHYLRHENKKLRTKIEKMREACIELKKHNARLEQANDVSASSYSTLTEHAQSIEETHKKLQEVVPKYKESVETLEAAVEMRRQFCLSEHKIKILYAKCIGKAVEQMENSCDDIDLVEELVTLCIQVENNENTMPLPPSLGKDDQSADVPSDTDSIDEYTVATLE